ncbi:MAG: hypothetical protein AAFU54_31290, partial [Chloroflexota bacterium]
VSEQCRPHQRTGGASDNRNPTGNLPGTTRPGVWQRVPCWCLLSVPDWMAGQSPALPVTP